MTFYVQEITTDADDKKTTRLKVWGGILTFMSIRFPPGPQALLKVAVAVGGHQIAPANEGTFFADDDQAIEFNDHIKLQSGWNVLFIHTRNTDTANSHSVRVRINVLPEWLADPRKAQREQAASLTTLLRRIGAL